MSAPQERDEERFPKMPSEFCIRLVSGRREGAAVPLVWLADAMRRVGGRGRRARAASRSPRRGTRLAVLEVLCDRFGPCFEAATGSGEWGVFCEC